MRIDPTGAPRDTIPETRKEQLRQVSEKLEAAFLAEMLKQSGVAKPSETMGGGAGETAFASFLSEAYADALAKQGSFGLSESIFNALVERENNR